MSPSILKCCLQLLLVLELGTECGTAISAFSYFPATMRNCWRKGLLLSGSHDSQPGKMLQQKRFKVCTCMFTIYVCNVVLSFSFYAMLFPLSWMNGHSHHQSGPTLSLSVCLLSPRTAIHLSSSPLLVRLCSPLLSCGR